MSQKGKPNAFIRSFQFDSLPSSHLATHRRSLQLNYRRRVTSIYTRPSQKTTCLPQDRSNETKSLWLSLKKRIKARPTVFWVGISKKRKDLLRERDFGVDNGEKCLMMSSQRVCSRPMQVLIVEGMPQNRMQKRIHQKYCPREGKVRLQNNSLDKGEITGWFDSN